jgi:hypothetical protein
VANPGEDGDRLSRVGVFGLSPKDPAIAEMYFNKSQRIRTVKDFLSQCDDASRVSFREGVFATCGMFMHYATVSERLIILFDNSILQDIIQHFDRVPRRPRYNAALASFAFVEDYCLLDIFSGVTPAILFEANGGKPVEAERDFRRVSKLIQDALIGVGLDTSFIGFDTVEQLADATRRIKHDEAEILRLLSEIKAKNWNIGIRVKRHEYPLPLPLAVAESSVPGASLAYFNPWHVKWLLMHDIVKRLYAANEQSLSFRDLCKQELDRGLPSILRIRKGRLQGLGDIEIFSFCELASQTGNNSPYITMALTFDNALTAWIASRRQVLSPSPSFRGRGMAEQFAGVLTYRIWRGHRKTEKVNKRYRENVIEFRRFWHENFVEFFPADELPPEMLEC